jgi:cytochrome c
MMKYNRNLISRSVLILALGGSALCAAPAPDSPELARSLGITFSSGTDSTLVLERDGKRYKVDMAAKTVQEIGAGAGDSAADLFQQNCAMCHGPDGKGKTALGTPDFTNPA